jgi:aryl-alcohol dehydrogenase-like predicted oxidoreductase
MGILARGPLAQGMLTGRARKGQQTDLRRAALFKAVTSDASTPLSGSSWSPNRPACG